MILFKKAADLHNWLDAQRKKGRRIGFVPTMGALHPGHISLVEQSKKTADITVCSIFVNPTQFNDPKDFQKYPITLEKDIDMLEGAGTDILFLPSTGEIYPGGIPSMTEAPRYELGKLETVLEGKFRPGHFQGVCLVVERLLRIVQPGSLFLGQKDYQQCMVIRKMMELKGLTEIDLVVCPTLREKDGLAMSSRNMRLDGPAREKAALISKVLLTIKKELKAGSVVALKEKAKLELEESGFKADYVEIADANDLSIIENWDGKKPVVALVAAFLGEVRLIDNLTLHP